MTASVDHRWPPGHPRVLVTDCWLTNAGDAAIAMGTQRLAQRHAPEAAILHAAYGSEHVGHHYPELRFVPPLEFLLGTRWSTPTPGWDVAGIELVTSADLIISQGGGFLREGYRPLARLDALARAVQGEVPFVVLGQTIGAFDLAFARRELGVVLRAASGVVVRDPRSLLHAIDLGAAGAHVRLGGDAALALVARRPDPPGEPLPVSVVLSAATVPDEGTDRTAAACTLLREVLRALPEDPVRVWSSAQSAGDEEDDGVASVAVDALDASSRSRVQLIEEHVPAGQMLEYSRLSSAMATMRFHPALLAATQGTPTVLLMDDQKADAFAGTRMEGRTVRALGPAGAGEAAAMLDPREPRWSGAEVLEPMLDRLDVTEETLESALHRIS